MIHQSVTTAAFVAIALFQGAQAQDVTPTTLASLHSSNPTAVPLTQINSAAPTQATVALASPATPGATPPVSGAPPLPSWAFSAADGWPALDEVPPINSSLVQGWIQEVKNSGVSIPAFGLTNAADPSCEGNPERVTNATLCWWTCGGCTRDTDITTCPDKMTWGVSYDDGPSPYSTDLLNYLDSQSIKSTFFIVGSRAISRPDILQAEYMSGHQISVHTWSHPYLTTLSNEQVIAELGWTRKAIKDITGVTPNTMRPPYGDIDDRIRAICRAMNLTPIMWSNQSANYFDTDDWHIPAGYPVQGVIDNFETILDSAPTLDTGFIVLEHDLYQQTVDLAIGYLLPDAIARGNINFKSIIECLGKPLEDSYVETNNNSTNPVGSGATTLSGGIRTVTNNGGPSQTGDSTSGQSTGSNAAALGTRVVSSFVLGPFVLVVAGLIAGTRLLF